MVEYKIKTSETDPKDSVIVKTGGEVEFTVRSIDNDVAYLEKTKKELTAQLGLEKATMENVARTHPQVAAMSQEDLTAAYLYRRASGIVTVSEEKLAEIEKQLVEYAENKAEIEKQTGIK